MTLEEPSPRQRTVADSTPEEAAERLAAVENALTTLINAMIAAANNRIMAVATKCVEILRGLIAEVKKQEPAWSLEWQADWIGSQLEAIASTLNDVADGIPDELASQFGSTMVDDQREALHHRVKELVKTALEACTEILEAELPEAMAYRKVPHESDAADDFEDDASTAVPLRERVGALHGGQLIMILVGSFLGSFLLAGGAAFAWLANAAQRIALSLSLAAVVSSSFGVWSLWVWLGARRAAHAAR